jgi:hypothetical protein
MSRSDWLVVLIVAVAAFIVVWGLGLLGWILDVFL